MQLPLTDLKAAFERVPDPRCQNGLLDYPLWLLLLALTVGLLAGQTSVLACAEWLAAQDFSFKQKLGFENALTPVQSTFQRLLVRLAPDALEQALSAYCGPLAGVSPQHLAPPRASPAVAIDGKCQKGRNQFAEIKKPVHLISLFCQQLGVGLAQSEIADGANEISSAPALLNQIEWFVLVLTGEAAYCQHQLCQQVVAAGGDYLFVVKGNQKQLQEDVQDVFDPQFLSAGLEFDLRSSQSLAKGHGRIEIREALASSELAGSSDWPHLALVLQIRRKWKERGVWKQDTRYGVSSLPKEEISVEKLAHYKRGHWGIENKLHWVRDVVLEEDASMMRCGNGPAAMAALRNTALNVLRLSGVRRISAELRHNVAQPHRILELLGLA